MNQQQTETQLHRLRMLLARAEDAGAAFSVFGEQERADECARFAEIVRCWIANIEAGRP